MPRPLTKSDVRQGLLFQDGKKAYTVSNVYGNHFTARLDYPVPPRTTVQTFDFDDVSFLSLRHATPATERKVADAYTEDGG